ncbi:hypothetical protein ACS0TY_017021 [Phlomoides rotata]
MWGIVKSIVDLCMKEGKFVLVKDPANPQVRIYDVPQDAFDNDYIEEPLPEDEQVQPPAEDAEGVDASAAVVDAGDKDTSDLLCWMVFLELTLVRRFRRFRSRPRIARDTRHVSIGEQVAIFLTVLSHHTKNRVIKHSFKRSGYTISKHFNGVLNTLLKLYNVLLVNPEPVPEDSNDYRWKYFKGCLGALDVCDHHMNFVFVLSGWEDSAADSRILRDALSRPNGLRVPNGCYYLCDGGYTNCNGFLAPYRGVRYHLKEWDDAQQPHNSQEYFNLKHARARNCIERSFGILKARWGILRSNSYYPIKTQNRSILGCCLLHNFIRKHMAVDPLEDEIDDVVDDGITMDGNSGACRGGRGRKRVGSTTRRVWTFAEECELMNALNDLVSKGHKCDNGFRSGYLSILENNLGIKFPGTDLKGEPHINSKIHVWKRQYVCLKGILGITGVGLNSTTYHVEALPEVWEARIKVDPFTKSLKNKAFPFYHQWEDIFGNDRANGRDSQLYADVVNEATHGGRNTSRSQMDVDEDVEENDTTDNYTTDKTSFSVDETSAAPVYNRKGTKRKQTGSTVHAYSWELSQWF